MKPLDKVAEAYYGSMGDLFSRKTRKRIHWICSKVEGETVLDVGCSQGITELLLAREGKRAVGIDIQESSIAYALNALENESDSVKKNVNYFISNVFDFESEDKFDTVILSEVMEHFTSSVSLLKKVQGYLVESGTIVITVPFGINDYFDHKKTYYMLNLIEEIEPFFEVLEIKFFGKWIGVVGRKTENQLSNNLKITRELVKQLEEEFYNIEREVLDASISKSKQIEQLNSQARETKEKLTLFLNENQSLKKEKETLIKENQLLKNENESLNDKKNIEDYLETIRLLEEKLVSSNEKIKEFKGEIESKNNELLDRLNSEEDTLNKHKDTIYRYNRLEAKHSNISKKYTLLSNAKLGRLTLKYWKYKKRIPEDF